MLKPMKITMRSWFATGLVALGGHAAAQAAAPVDPALGPQVISYASAGENSARQDREQDECYFWAGKQSGFDPSQSNLAPHQRVVVRSGPPPGADVAAGAVTGAVIGAAVGAPHESGEGAIVGAMAGAVVGSAAESSQQSEAAQMQSETDRNATARQARLDAQASGYPRALSAGPQGRG